jgi:hypothetical protein
MTTRILDSPRPAVSRAFVCLAACALLLAAAPSVATAATFDPAAIVSDDNMRAVYSIGSAAEIQAFLEAANTAPSTGSALKYLVTPDVNGIPKRASVIIWEACQAYQISPKVMLVMLQKEQSLLTRTAPAQNTLDRALGAGCPNATTNKFPGFGNQVWNAARLLDGYGEGRVTYVRLWFSGIAVQDIYRAPYPFIEPVNIATYKLYVYNPSIGASPPYGDLSTQSTGGNANFWKIYWKYFNDPWATAVVRPVYRFYNKKIGTHFYTASEAERYVVASKWGATYQFEGTAYSVNTTNAANCVPLYRFFNVKKGSHFYTASEAEKAYVIRTWPKVFRLEGTAYNVSLTPEGGTPVYRFYNVKNGTHFYTANPAERDYVMATWPRTYTPEGIAFYLAP